MLQYFKAGLMAKTNFEFLQAVINTFLKVSSLLVWSILVVRLWCPR